MNIATRNQYSSDLLGKFIRIKDSMVGSSNFPPCICLYQNIQNGYMMVEVNTGYHKGSLKSITQSYSSYQQLIENFDQSKQHYPFLNNYIIYNDHISKL